MIRLEIPEYFAGAAIKFFQEIERIEAERIMREKTEPPVRPSPVPFYDGGVAAAGTVIPLPSPLSERVVFPDQAVPPPPVNSAPVEPLPPPPPIQQPNDAYDKLQDMAAGAGSEGEEKEISGNEIQVDSEGLPWDARIHSSSHAILAKGGAWKLARNIDKNLVASVRAELIAKRDAVKNASAPAPLPSAPQPNGPAPLPPIAPSVLRPGPVPPPPANGEAQWNFGEFCQKVIKKGLTFDMVSPVCQSFGLKDQTQLALNPAYIMPVAKALGLI